MTMRSSTATPFDEGKKAARLDCQVENPHAEGSIEHRNYELGRQYGLRNLTAREPYLTSRTTA